MEGVSAGGGVIYGPVSGKSRMAISHEGVEESLVKRYIETQLKKLSECVEISTSLHNRIT